MNGTASVFESFERVTINTVYPLRVCQSRVWYVPSNALQQIEGYLFHYITSMSFILICAVLPLTLAVDEGRWSNGPVNSATDNRPVVQAEEYVVTCNSTLGNGSTLELVKVVVRDLSVGDRETYGQRANVDGVEISCWTSRHGYGALELASRPLVIHVTIRSLGHLRDIGIENLSRLRKAHSRSLRWGSSQ
jgi:hypothetical protein